MVSVFCDRFIKLSVIACRALVSCRLPTGPGLAPECRLGSGGSPAHARVRAGEADRADYEVGARPDRRENPDGRKNIDPGKILYIIMFNSTSGYRLGNDLKAIQIINESR